MVGEDVVGEDVVGEDVVGEDVVITTALAVKVCVVPNVNTVEIEYPVKKATISTRK